MRRSTFFLLMVLLVAPLDPARGETEEESWVDLWGTMLTRHTRAVDAEVGTRVDYRALSRDPLWPQVVAGLGEEDPRLLETREEKLAFWINAYNILAIDLVIQNYPIQSIRDIGYWFSPVWKKTAGQIGGRSYSLDEIEHEILRPLGDPRIHGAIVCASISCPSLLRTPYRAPTVGSQMDESLRAWMRRPDKGMVLDPENRVLRVSKVFDWFREDFESVGGVRPFVTRYAPPEEAAWLAEESAPVSIRYFDYDWNLND